MPEEQSDKKWFFHLIAFFAGAMTLLVAIMWFNLKAGLMDHMRNPQLIEGINAQILPVLEWFVIAGGVVCACILMMITAWAIFRLARLNPVLNTPLHFRRAKGGDGKKP